MGQPAAGDLDLVISRVIDATPERVFRAWTDPAQLPEFWGPHGMTTPVCEMDVRPGGRFRTVMRAPDGTEYPSRGVFLDVAAPHRLVFSDAFDEDWRPAEKPFMTAVVTFEPADGKTMLVARARHATVADRDRHEQMGFHVGWGQSLDRLEALMAKGD